MTLPTGLGDAGDLNVALVGLEDTGAATVPALPPELGGRVSLSVPVHFQ